MSETDLTTPQRIQGFRQSLVFLMSVADIFVGASAVLIILVVLSSNSDEKRTFETYDKYAFCSGTSSETFRISPTDDTTEHTLDEWLSEIPTNVPYQRWLIRPKEETIDCFLIAQRAAIQRNEAHAFENNDSAVLIVEFLPRNLLDQD